MHNNLRTLADLCWETISWETAKSASLQPVAEVDTEIKGKKNIWLCACPQCDRSGQHRKACGVTLVGD